MQKTRADASAAGLWLVLSRAHHAIAEYMHRSIAGLGIGLTDFAVLEALLHKGPLSMCDLAAKVLLANASTTSAVDRLSHRGLVRRTPGRGDRRVKLVELTTEGRTLARKLFALHEHDIDRLMAPLAPEEKKHLRAGLKQIGLHAQQLLATEAVAGASS